MVQAKDTGYPHVRYGAGERHDHFSSPPNTACVYSPIAHNGKMFLRHPPAPSRFPPSASSPRRGIRTRDLAQSTRIFAIAQQLRALLVLAVRVNWTIGGFIESQNQLSSGGSVKTPAGFSKVRTEIHSVMATPGRIRGLFEGRGVSSSRVSPPGPLSISFGHVGCLTAGAFPAPV
jgi:hypothetical protein